ncbi:MAG: serine hydrolase, partial [Chitinophagaceae bacterium]
MFRLLFIIITALTGVTAVAQTQPVNPLLLDSLVNTYSKQHKFNGSVLVAQKGTILLQKGYGYQDVAQKTTADANSLYQYGSVTKQFTAVLIMYLQEKKKLSIHDKLSKYFPDLPFGDSVTIVQMLTHTSGIYNYTNDEAFMATEAVKPAASSKILALIRNHHLEFTPGIKFSYSNSNYYLLGLIIQKASGQPYEKLMRQIILAPVGMKTAGFDFAHNHSSHRTTGYNSINDDHGDIASIVDSSASFAAGALYGSVYDLYAWHQALQKNQLLTTADWKQVYTPVHDNYGFGWMISTLYGKPLVEHGGGIFGYTSMIKRFPQDDVVVIVLSNSSSPKVQEIATSLSALVFGQPVNWPIEQVTIQLPEEKLTPLVGDYELNPGFTISVTIQNGQLKAKPTGQSMVNLLAENDTTFRVEVI